jgi:hypothetical protein
VGAHAGSGCLSLRLRPSLQVMAVIERYGMHDSRFLRRDYASVDLWACAREEAARAACCVGQREGENKSKNGGMFLQERAVAQNIEQQHEHG